MSSEPAAEPAIGPGVHVRAGVASDWVDTLDHAGWKVGWLTGGEDRHEVLGKLAEACDFPGWYGVNLDAAWDCLTDLKVPTAVVWDQWQSFAVEHPADFAAVLTLWHDRADQQPDFAVVMVA